jgi:hypothetical protein
MSLFFQALYRFVVSCHVPQAALCASAVNNPLRRMGEPAPGDRSSDSGKSKHQENQKSS